jgi:mRNA interferase RelE/StbE
MNYRLELTAKAIEELEALTSTVQERILGKIRWLGENFEGINPQALSANLNGLFKLRVGDYRVIYSFDRETQYITIHKVGHRRDIYD